MKKIPVIFILSFLMIFSLQQMTFAEEDEEKNKNAEEARAQTLAEAARAEKAATEAEREEKKANDAANAARDKEIAEAGNYLKRYGGIKKMKKKSKKKKVEI